MPKAELREGVSLTAGQLHEVRCILSAHVPGCQVWVFGSRVNGGVKPFSDLDLGLDGAEALSLAKQAELAEAFGESDLPFRVDVVDLATADQAFAAQVRRTGVLLRCGE